MKSEQHLQRLKENIAQQSSAGKASFPKFSISTNRTYTQTHIHTHNHTHTLPLTGIHK